MFEHLFRRGELLKSCIAAYFTCDVKGSSIEVVQAEWLTDVAESLGVAVQEFS